MSSLLSSIYYTPPLSLARQNKSTTKTTRKIYPPKKLRIPNKPNPPPPTKNQVSPSIGTDATTYTRLPPKDDFFHEDDSSYEQFASILKLSDVTFPTIEEKTVLIGELGDLGKRVEPNHTEFEGERVLVGELDDLGKRVESDYSEFEVFDADFDTDEEGDVGLDGKVLNFDDTDGVFNANSDEEFDTDGDIVNFSGNEGVFEGGEEGEEVKEKGVPAVMRCFDRAKVFVKAGDGGNGVVAFRREKYVPFGGPSGGDGGRGGHVYVEVDGSMNSLLPFRNSLHFRAGRGSHGQGSKMAGAKGEDIVVKVAPGTVIREAVKEGIQGEVLLELLHPGQRALLLPGGRGGRGNASFKSGTNKVPRIAELGEEGPEMWLDLELKLVADIGIVGAPNAGKSTLLSVISAAEPSIANYPFTTLLPNLGVVTFGFDTTLVVADLPGLLEGAHRGFGLGHEFLRHTERCSALVHVVDGSAQQPEYEFDAIRLELELFNPEIAEKPFLVAFNKMDLPEAYERWPTFRENLQARGIEPFCMSAINRDGTHEVITTVYQLLQKRIEETKREAQGWNGSMNLNHVAETVRKQRNASINEFEITHDSSCNTWHVDGSGLQRFVQMTNWSYIDSEKRFQHILEACGVYKSLTKLGVKEGDTVVVGEMELVWHDSINTGPLNIRKKGTGAIKWHSLK